MMIASAERVLLLTMALSATKCSIANGVEGAKDGTLATDGDLAKESDCVEGGNLTMKGTLPGMDVCLHHGNQLC